MSVCIPSPLKRKARFPSQHGWDNMMSMTKQAQLRLLPPLPVAVDALILEHGSWRFVAAALAGLFRAPLLRHEVDTMPDYLRHDIGLPPKARPSRLKERIR